jgi:hypothetical protein
VSERRERTIIRRRGRVAERGDHVLGEDSRSETTP